MSSTQAISWLYFGSGKHSLMSDEEIDAPKLPEVVCSNYLPHPIVRNLGTKDVELPYMLRQARPPRRYLEPAFLNDYGYRDIRDTNEIGPDTPRMHFRSVYVDRNYALGTGNSRNNIGNPEYRTAVTNAAVWKSRNRFSTLIVGHPYYFPKKIPKDWDGSHPPGWDSVSSEDMWCGINPFQQTVHWENAAIFLYDIPDKDPYQGTEFPFGGPTMKPVEPLPHPIQSCFAYYPETVEERAEKDGIFFLRENDTYVAVRPLNEGAGWAASKMSGFGRIDMPGSVTGCVVEMGDEREFGSFPAFQERIAEASLDTAAIDSEREVRYTSARGHGLIIRHSSDGWLPESSVNGEQVDFEAWPICESRYLSIEDRVMKVSDGVNSLEIDWSGDLPVYRQTR